MSAFISEHLNTIWITIGLLGQAMFTGRFVIQWLASEKAKQSVMPNLFWYFSIAGGLIILAYAIYRKDPVYILGQSCGVFVYTRNLYFIHSKKHRKNEQPATDTA